VGPLNHLQRTDVVAGMKVGTDYVEMGWAVVARPDLDPGPVETVKRGTGAFTELLIRPK